MLVTNVVYWAVVVIFIVIAAIVLWNLWKVDLGALICEMDGKKASLSRFQFLLFTFVVAGVWLTLCIESGTFVEIPGGVLGLIGISGGSYVVSKGISGQSSGAPPGSGRTVPPADGGDNPAARPAAGGGV